MRQPVTHSDDLSGVGKPERDTRIDLYCPVEVLARKLDIVIVTVFPCREEHDLVTKLEQILPCVNHIRMQGRFPWIGRQIGEIWGASPGRTP